MISLTLTCVNIVCIVMVGVLMLLVKQVQNYTILANAQKCLCKWSALHVCDEDLFIGTKNVPECQKDMSQNKYSNLH